MMAQEPNVVSDGLLAQRAREHTQLTFLSHGYPRRKGKMLLFPLPAFLNTLQPKGSPSSFLCFLIFTPCQLVACFSS